MSCVHVYLYSVALQPRALSLSEVKTVISTSPQTAAFMCSSPDGLLLNKHHTVLWARTRSVRPQSSVRLHNSLPERSPLDPGLSPGVWRHLHTLPGSFKALHGLWVLRCFLPQRTGGSLSLCLGVRARGMTSSVSERRLHTSLTAVTATCPKKEKLHAGPP